jgi:rubrerythrin
MDDLISRVAAIAKVEKARKAARTLTGMDFVLMLKDQPAVDAVPVVQGEWVEEPDRREHYHCSNCGVVWGITAKAMKYCPNCAAKMMNSPMWEVDGERRESE